MEIWYLFVVFIIVLAIGALVSEYFKNETDRLAIKNGYSQEPYETIDDNGATVIKLRWVKKN